MPTMKILIRNQKSKDWKVVESATYGAEAELQALIANSPSLVPVNEIRAEASLLVVAIREFGLPGSGNTDVLSFSADGDIAIIECKLAANPESKRKVIGQILEYGAYLWGMTYEEVDRRVKTLRGKSLADLVAESVSDSEWDEENFRNSVKQKLESGAFILIIAVDEMNLELSRTISFLNSCGNPAFSFSALEMRRFQQADTEILVPDLHDPSARGPKPMGGRKKWTEEQFFEAIQRELSPEVVEVIRNLYEWSQSVADRVWFGAGTATGSFTFHYLKDGKTMSVFSIYTSGYLVLNYGWLSTQVKRVVIQEFHNSIHNILSFKNVSADFSKWPSIEIAEAFLRQADALEQFEAAVKALGDKVRSSE
jgi:hypothetical protein